MRFKIHTEKFLLELDSSSVTESCAIAFIKDLIDKICVNEYQIMEVKEDGQEILKDYRGH